MTRPGPAEPGWDERSNDHPERSALARAWAGEVAGTSYVPMGPGELTAFLRGLVDRLFDLLHAPALDPRAAQQVGADLVAAHFTDTGSLSRTVMVLTRELPNLVNGPVLRGGRIDELVSELAAGFATAVRDVALLEQELIQRAAGTAQRATEQRLAASEARFRTIFTGAPIGIGIADMQGRIEQANPALLTMLGYQQQAFLEMQVSDMVHPDDAPSVWEVYAELITGRREQFRVEKRFFRSDGAVIWTDLRVALVRDEHGVPAYQIAMMEDVTDRRRLQASLEHLAYHDPLTGLPNRALFSRRLAAAFDSPAGADPSGRRIGLCYLDLDGFKAINDSLGHDTGDRLLVLLADRLAGCCGPHSQVARMGGDEFVILVENSRGVDDVIALADAVLTALLAPFRLGDHELQVTASIGIVEQRIVDTSPADLLSAADITLYWAKDGGKARYAVYEANRLDSDITRLTLASAMPGAIDRGEFTVHYQPIVSLADGRVRGVEALVRWLHPRYGMLLPDRFVPVAEETGAIVPLGRFVLRRACEQARRWQRELGADAPYVSVNLAPRQLLAPGLVSDVAQALDGTGLDPRHLQFELTEKAVMPEGEDALQALRALSRRGVRLAIDDFGTGYSNLAYLRELPVHQLKLDSSFVRRLRGAGTDPADELLVSTLINLAHGLGLTVTAEGVENEVQLTQLRALGCDGGQGWLFGPPNLDEQLLDALRGGVSELPIGDGRPG